MLTHLKSPDMFSLQIEEQESGIIIEPIHPLISDVIFLQKMGLAVLL